VDQRSWIVIDRAAVLHNIEQIVRYCGSAEIGLVVKSNAYGHGLAQIVAVVRDDPRISWLLVAGTSEALHVRALGWKRNILAMTYHDADAAEVIRAGIVVALAELNDVVWFVTAARAVGMRARMHIKIETGMNRRGFTSEDLVHHLPVLQSMPELSIEGAFTHLCDTNNHDSSFTFAQQKNFDDTVYKCGKIFPAFHHVLASGSLWMPHKYHMVRVGTALYGSWKSPLQRARLSDIELQPIMRWYTRIMHIKTVEMGDSIGYDCTFRAPHRMRIALLPVGYADGYQRRLASCGYVMVRDEYAPLVGVISMNMMAIDVSHISACVLGDEVLLIGPHERISPAALAQILRTNPNEITTTVSRDIVRIIL
jgi:alanine racemase